MSKLLDKLPFAKHAWFGYIRYLIRHYLDDECTQKSASLTYTTLLSLVPIITVVIVLFSVVPAMSEMREQLQDMIYDNLLPTSSESIRTHLESFAEKSSNLGLIGVAGVFVTTIMTLLTIEGAFNKIWRVEERSGFLNSVLRYWTMITLAPIVLGVAFVASSAITGLSLFNQKFMGYGIDWAIWAKIVSFMVMTAGFVGMYWFVPKTQVPIKNALIAGVVTAVLFETLKTLFGTIVSNFTSYEAIYGAFAIIPVFLMWLYLSWNIILLGVEISYTLTIFESQHAPSQHAFLSILQMLRLTYERHQEGKTVSEQELRATLSQDELTHWSAYINKLTQHKLIRATQDHQYVLSIDLETISLWQLYRSLPYRLPFGDEMHPAGEHDALWLDKLHTRLSKTEQLTQNELDVSLKQLFGNTPDVMPEPPPADPVPTPTTNSHPLKSWLHQSTSFFKHTKDKFKR